MNIGCGHGEVEEVAAVKFLINYRRGNFNTNHTNSFEVEWTGYVINITDTCLRK
jgi:hypothetical protein